VIKARDIAYRYWPTLALVVALVVLVVLLPSNTSSGPQVRAGGQPVATTRAGATPTTTPRAGQTQAAPAPGASPGTVGAPAPAAGGGTTGGSGTVAGGATGGTTSGGGAATGGASTSGGGAAPSAPPGQSSDAETASGVVPVDTGGGLRPKYDPPPGPQGCRAADGKQDMVGYGVPQCIPLFTGDNGAATYPGVTADTITLAFYHGQADPAVTAALTAAGVSDTPEQDMRVEDTLAHYESTHIETYGREIKIVHVQASGDAGNETAQRADGVKIVEEIHAFACLDCPRYAAEEVIARGHPVIGTFETTNYFVERVRGFYFGANPSLEEHSIHIAENWGKRLMGRKAKFAGDPLIQAQERKLGIMWIDGGYGRVDEGAKLANDFFLQELAKYGAAPVANVFYNFDYGKAGEQAANMISKMRAGGATTLTFVGDPLYPVFITHEASRQNYYPEWYISGSALTDITFFGRTYDQTQWSHAFGQSALWVFWNDNRTSDGYREYHHVCEGFNKPADCEDRDEGVNINTVRATIALSALGIHGAGPNLNPQTFEQGMYAFPEVGGWPSTSHLFFTREKPWALQDRTEIFWDPTGYGPDEINKQGPGIMLKANGGKRYLPGEWPTTEFENDKSKAVFVSDEPIGAPYKLTPHEADGHKHPGDQRCRSCR